MSENQLAVIPALIPSTMEQAVAFAQQMSEAKLLPKHLQKSPADCLRVVLQSARWQMDPFAVADKTSIIQDKLMYEGQLVSAVVNARGNLSKRLSYSYRGEGDARVLTVSGVVRGEDEPRTIDLPFTLAKKINRNGQMNTNPDQQAAYIGARIWARRHMPELMLGVYTPDEVSDDDASGEPVNVTPDRPPPPPRTKRGAAAVKENAKVVDAVVETAATTDAPKQQVNPEGNGVNPAPPIITEGGVPKAPEKVETFQQAAEASSPAPRAFLNDGETIKAKVTVKALEVVNIQTANGATPSVKANVSGEYVGDIRHIGAATAPKPGQPLSAENPGKPSDPWAIGAELNVTIRGKKSTTTDPKHANYGKVVVWCDGVEAVTTAEESQ